MRKRRNHSTPLDRILNTIFSFRGLRFFLFGLCIVALPSTVTDGMLSDQEAEVHVRIPQYYQTHGLDVSHHNGSIDWGKISAYNKHLTAVKFCFVKATEGTDLVDPRFKTNWKALRQHKIKRGAYHFFYPYSDPKLQALNFILSVRYEAGDIVPVLDWEQEGTGQSRANTAHRVKAWLEVIETHYGVKPIIYTNKIIYRKYFSEGDFDGYPLWISHFEVPELAGYDLSDVYFWQYSMKGRVEGINTLVDLNVFLKDRTDFEELTFRK